MKFREYSLLKPSCPSEEQLYAGIHWCNVVEKTQPSITSFARWPVNKGKHHFPQKNGAWQAQNCAAMVSDNVLVLCSISLSCFTGFRILITVFCISITSSNGCGFIRAVTSLFPGIQKTFKSKKTSQLPIHPQQGPLQQFMSHVSW